MSSEGGKNESRALSLHQPAHQPPDHAHNREQAHPDETKQPEVAGAGWGEGGMVVKFHVGDELVRWRDGCGVDGLLRWRRGNGRVQKFGIVGWNADIVSHQNLANVRIGSGREHDTRPCLACNSVRSTLTAYTRGDPWRKFARQ